MIQKEKDEIKARIKAFFIVIAILFFVILNLVLFPLNTIIWMFSKKEAKFMRFAPKFIGKYI